MAEKSTTNNRYNYYNDDHSSENNTANEEKMQQKGAAISESFMYQLFVKSAYRLLKKPLVLLKVLKKAVARLQQYGSIRAFADDMQYKIKLMIRMVRAYVSKEYTQLSISNVALCLAALLYFIAPFDLIPDFLALGFVDDLAILTWVYNNFKNEMEAFEEWEDNEHKIRIDISDYQKLS